MTSRAFALLSALTVLASLLAIAPQAAAAPVFDSTGPIAPTSGSTNGGTTLTLKGSGFAAGAVVLFTDASGTYTATGLTFTNPDVGTTYKTITAVTPAHAAGVVAVVVKNPDASQAVSSNGFTFVTSPAPTLASIAPTAGTANGNLVVVLTGTGFCSAQADGSCAPGTISPRVLFGATVSGTTVTGGIPAAVLQPVTPTKLAVLTPGRGATAGSSTVSVSVQNPDGGVASIANAYSYIGQQAPGIASVSPLSGSDSGGTVLTLTGSGFAPGATVVFSSTSPATSAPAAAVDFVSPTQLNVVTPAATDASPALPVTAGAIHIQVTNPDGSPSGINSVSYSFTNDLPPTISTVAPTGGPALGGTTVNVTGSGFVKGPKLAVKFAFPGVTNPVPATGVTWVSSTRLTAVTPACAGNSCSSASVVASVTVTNPDNKPSAQGVPFTYSPVVRIDSIEAPGDVGGATFTVGTGGSSAGGVELKGSGLPTPCRVLLLAPTLPTIEAPTPTCAPDRVTFTAPPATTGTRDVAVVGPGAVAGVLSPDGHAAILQGGLAYVYGPAPAITSFSVSPAGTAGPQSAPSNGATEAGPAVLTISGSNFIPLQDASGAFVSPVVKLGTATAKVTGATSGTITVTVPAYTSTIPPAGQAVELIVTNVDLQTKSVKATDATHFTYTKDAGPTLTTTCTVAASNCPSGKTTGHQLVALSGTNFVLGTTVLFGTTPVPVTALCSAEPPTPTKSCITDANNLQVYSPPTGSGTAATVAIKVANPDNQQFAFPGTGPSESFVYTTTTAPTVSAVAPSSLTGNGGPITISNNGQPFVWGPAFTVTVDTTIIPACTAIITVRCIVSDPCSATVTNYCIDVASGGNLVKVTAPGHAVGSVSVRVANADTQSDTRTGALSYGPAAPPALVDATPGNGGAGAFVALTGTDFSVGPALLPSISFGNTPAIVCTAANQPVAGCQPPATCTALNQPTPGCRAPITVGTTTTTYRQIFVKVPAGLTGPQTITLANPSGSTASVSSAFRALALPSAITLLDNTDTINGGKTVKFKGTGFDPAASLLVLFGGASGVALAGSPDATTTTDASATVPVGQQLGQTSVYLVDQDGQSVTVPLAFVYSPALPPSFASINPPLVSVDGDSPVDVVGYGFSPSARVCLRALGATTFTGGVVSPPCTATSPDLLTSPVKVSQPTSTGATTLTFVAPSHAAGPVDIVITNPSGSSADSLLLPGAQSRFAYTAVPGPHISSIAPATGDVAGGTPVTITGTNFGGSSGASVTFNGTAATDVQVVSDTTITAKTPPGRAGVAEVVVTVAGLHVISPTSFTYTGATTTPTPTPTPTPGPTGNPTGTPTTGPPPVTGTLTNDQIISANKAVKVTVTRDGDDNVVTFVLPNSPPATPAGVQVFRSNSPYVLVGTLASGSPGYTARSYRDVGAPLASTYKVTVYYAGGAGKAASAPTEVPGFDQLAGVQSDAVQQDLYTKVAYGIGIGILAILVIVLLVVLLRRSGRNRATQPAYTGGDVGYVAPPAEEQAPAETVAAPGPTHTINCPVCKATFEAVGEKPLRMKCPNCGREGILR